MPHFQAHDVLAAMTGRYGDFYSQYTPLKPISGELRGPCPLHGGQGQNFAVNPETGLWHCFTQCQGGGDVFDFLMRKEGSDFPEALAAASAWSGSSAGVPAASSVSASQKPGPRRIAETYDYTDEAGTLLFQAVRYTPKGFNQRRPDGDGGWIWNLGDARRVLYRLPEVLAAAAAGKPIYFCEGEKDADRLAALGLTATTAPMGAMKKPEQWEAGYTEALSGAAVVILPDNDPAGTVHAAIVAAALHGSAKRVRVAPLPGLPEKGDVSDWLNAGGTAEALIRQAKQVPDWTEPPPEDREDGGKSGAEKSGAAPARRKPIAGRIVDLADVEPPTELPLLFGQYLLKGAAHWLTGQTGLGKSTLLFNIACALAEGTPLWGIECEQTRILYCDMESGDVGRAHKIERLYQGSPRVRGQLLFLREPIKLPEELSELAAFASEAGVSLIIFDTARRVFSVKDENDNAEVYARIVPTLDALKAAGIATLTLGHPSKNGNGSARGAGAQEDAGDVNLTLTLHGGEPTDKNAVIALRVTKNRLLGLGIPPMYLRRIGEDQFERMEGMDSQTAEEPASKRLQCRAAIADYLAGLPNRLAPFTSLIDAMKAQGFTQATARRAKDDMEAEGDLLRAPGGGFCLPDPFE